MIWRAYDWNALFLEVDGKGPLKKAGCSELPHLATSFPGKEIL